MRGAVPTELQRDLQERWLRQAHEAWTQRREARLDEADAQGLPPEETALCCARARAMRHSWRPFCGRSRRQCPFAHTLPKDLLDIAPDVLRDTWAHTPRPDGVPEGIWAAFCSVRASDMSSFCRSGGVDYIFFGGTERCVSQEMHGALGMAHGDDRAVRA